VITAVRYRLTRTDNGNAAERLPVPASPVGVEVRRSVQYCRVVVRCLLYVSWEKRCWRKKRRAGGERRSGEWNRRSVTVCRVKVLRVGIAEFRLCRRGMGDGPPQGKRLRSRGCRSPVLQCYSTTTYSTSAHGHFLLYCLYSAQGKFQTVVLLSNTVARLTNSLPSL